jgi:hypothetical protein
MKGKRLEQSMIHSIGAVMAKRSVLDSLQYLNSPTFLCRWCPPECPFNALVGPCTCISTALRQT